MREYTTIILRESVNGFLVHGYDGGKEHFDSVHEERLEALKAIDRWVRFEIETEYERRKYAPSL